MRFLIPFLFGIISTIFGEVGLALNLVDTVETDVEADVGRFESAFAAIGATIDAFLSNLQPPFSG